MTDYLLPTDRLAELVEQKLKVLEQLCELSRFQQDLIIRDDTNEVLVHLSRKQKLFDVLELVQDQMASFQGENPDEHSWESQEKRENCRRQNDRCKGLLNELMIVEQRSVETMSARRDTVTLQLQENERAQRVQAAYQRQSESMYDDNSLSLDM